jgi:hypothetical protein
LKKTLAKLFEKAKEKPVQWISIGNKKPASTSPILSITFVLEKNISFYNGVKFIFPKELDETSVLLALNDLPSGIARAISTEHKFLRQIGGSFLGSRTSSYVYLPGRLKWLEITPKLIREESALGKAAKPKKKK